MTTSPTLAGLADYWILDLIAGMLEVCREVVPASGHVTPLAAPTARVPVADLLP